MFTLAIVLAAITAVALALGTHMQHRAVRAQTVSSTARCAGTEGDRVTSPGLGSLIRSPLWLLGTLDIGLAMVLNIVALALAPVSLVQPIGALSLVASVLISAVALGKRITRGVVAGVVLTTVSVSAFVWASAAHARETVPSSAQVLCLAALLAACALGSIVVVRSRAGHLLRVMAAGITYGCVAAGAHVLGAAAKSALGAAGEVPLWTSAGADRATAAAPAAGWPALIVLLLALGCAVAVGMWLVQSAYASGPPETVLAGLTVIDPFTAVGIGALILGEYSRIPVASLVVLLATGAGAFIGIALLARHVPDREPIEPGSARGPRPSPGPEPALQPSLAPGPRAPRRSAAARREPEKPPQGLDTAWENAR